MCGSGTSQEADNITTTNQQSSSVTNAIDDDDRRRTSDVPAPSRSPTAAAAAGRPRARRRLWTLHARISIVNPIARRIHWRYDGRQAAEEERRRAELVLTDVWPDFHLTMTDGGSK